VTTVVHEPAAAPEVTSAGQVIVHPAPLVTVTVKEQLAVVLDESVAMQVTVVIPTPKGEPDAGSHTTTTQFPVAAGDG
jgi:hypothetical protein